MALYSLYNSAENCPINTSFLNELLQSDLLEWPSFSKQEFRDAIAKCSFFSISGPDHILWRHLKLLIMDDTYLGKNVYIANTYINLKFWLLYFKTAITVVIPKPNKELYNMLKFFQPIVLLNTTGKLIEKVISNHLQFYMISNRFLNPNQFGGIRQCSTISVGLYLTHLICTDQTKQCYISIIVFGIAQFFLSLNHTFLSICFKKADLNSNIIKFFDNYYSNCSTTYTWNGFSSPLFNTNVGVGQGLVLFSIISAIYLALIIKIFKKRIKNIKEKIPIDILFFVDDSLLISQKKSYDLFLFFFLYNHNIMAKILLDSSLVIEYSKSEMFYFTRS